MEVGAGDGDWLMATGCVVHSTLWMNRGMRAERLLTLSSAGRRLSDLVSASVRPLRYEVMRHLLRVSEETMTETLEEVVELHLVRRGSDAFTYVPFDEATGDAIRGEHGCGAAGAAARADRERFAAGV